MNKAPLKQMPCMKQIITQVTKTLVTYSCETRCLHHIQCA